MTKINVKAKIQDKEEHLRQCQGKDSRQGSKTKDNVKAKIQDKELRLRTMSRPKSKTSKFLKNCQSNILQTIKMYI